MNIKFDGRFPIHLQVQRVITQRIANNDYIEGLKIPTANVLCEELGVNYHTVRRAITELVGSLLTVVRGKGTFVSNGSLEKARSIEKTLVAYETSEIVRASRSCRIKQAELIDLVKAEFKKQLAEGE